LKIYPLYLLTNWCILVAKIGALLIAIFGALLLTDYREAFPTRFLAWVDLYGNA